MEYLIVFTVAAMMIGVCLDHRSLPAERIRVETAHTFNSLVGAHTASS